MNSPILNLPLLQPAQALKHITVNEALLALETVAQISVIDDTLTTPPLEPSEGTRYIVAPNATDAWSGMDERVALWRDSSWHFFEPQAGWLIWVQSRDVFYVYDGTEWTEWESGAGSTGSATGGDELEFFGINATADTTNRLSVNAPATLLNHEGGDHQLKINKNGAVDTGSLLFQSGFSGRAEMGLAGNDDFSVKVSDDGQDWSVAFAADGGTGHIGIGHTAPACSLHIAQSTDYAALRISGFDDEAGDYLDCHLGGILARILTNKPNMWFRVGSGTPLKLREDSVSIEGDLAADGSFTINDDKYLRLGTNHDFRLGYSDTTNRLNLQIAGSSQSALAIVPDGSAGDFIFNNNAVKIGADGRVGIGTVTPSVPLEVDGPVRVGQSDVASLPDASLSGSGAILFVTDASPSAMLAVSDGTDWRRTDDGSIVV